MISIQSFRRVTSSNNFIPEIDGLRFIAIITVVFLHTNTNFLRVYENIVPADYSNSFIFHLLDSGSVGVDVFFSISGFILGLPFAKYYLQNGHKVSIKNYFIRRLTRLEPPYILSLVVLFVAGIFVSGYTWAEYGDSFIATLLYVHFPLYGVWSPINPVTWSLEVEVQFYILAPLLAALLFIKNTNARRVLLPLTIIAIDIIVPYLFDDIVDLRLHKTIVSYLHSFLVGFLFVEIYLFGLDKIKKSYLFDVLGVLALVLIYQFHLNRELYGRIVFDAGALMLFLSVFRGRLFNSFFTKDVITAIGGMCYSIYLLHYAVLYIVMKGLSVISFGGFLPSIIINFTISIFALLVVSAVFFKLVEQPCMDKNWPQKLMNYFKTRLSTANAKS